MLCALPMCLCVCLFVCFFVCVSPHDLLIASKLSGGMLSRRLWTTFGVVNHSLKKTDAVMLMFTNDLNPTYPLIVEGVMETCALGTGHAILYWPVCDQIRTRADCFPMAWGSSAGNTVVLSW